MDNSQNWDYVDIDSEISPENQKMQKRPRRLSEAGKKRLSFVLEKALIASFLGHATFILLFLWLGIKEMVILNIFSTMSLFIGILCTRKDIFIPAFIIGTSEIVLHACGAVYYVGWNSGFHYYLIVLVPFLFFWPTWKTGIKIFSSLLLFVLYTCLFLLSQNQPQIYQLDIWQSNLTNMGNIFLAFASFASVALFYQITTNEVEQRLREANTQLDSLARTDPLTALQNRRTIVERMGEEENRLQINGKIFSIIMADVDHFKTFNDKYGHMFGDQVLVSIAALLKSATRTKDIVARWGGEEFLILLPETGGDEAREVADRMRMVISQTPISLEGREIHLSMTFGVAECTSDLGINECIDRADKALYRGKGNGRNQVVLLKNTVNQSAS